MGKERLLQLEEYIKVQQKVSPDYYAEKFGVSMSTLRRDINTLVQIGCVKKLMDTSCITTLLPKSSPSTYAAPSIRSKSGMHAQPLLLSSKKTILFLLTAAPPPVIWWILWRPLKI